MARILITDDQAPMRSMMALAVRMAGHTVMEAASAREALQLHDASPADLVVTDMIMKDMDGTELLRRLRVKSPETPVIAVSGARQGTIYLNMAKLIGADCLLAKPFEAKQLVDKIDTLLATGASRGGG